MAATYGPVLARIGADPHAGAYAADAPDRQRLRTALVSLLAEEARDPALRTSLAAAARASLGGDAKALDQSLMRSALVVHLQEGGVAAATALAKMLSTSEDSTFRVAARAALGQSGDPAIARWLLEPASNASFRPSDRSNILGDLMRDPGTRDLAYAYLTAHFDELAKDTGIFGFGRLFAITDGFCSVAKADEIEKTLGARVRQYKRGGLELARAVETVRSCGLLQEKRGAELVAALGS